MKLNGKALGLSLGIIWAAMVFLATMSVVVRGGTGELTGKLARFYLGYSLTFTGAVIGAVWGFIHMFITGFILAVLYNAFSMKSRIEMKKEIQEER